MSNLISQNISHHNLLLIINSIKSRWEILILQIEITVAEFFLLFLSPQCNEKIDVKPWPLIKYNCFHGKIMFSQECTVITYKRCRILTVSLYLPRTIIDSLGARGEC